jgi:hypothetical protein
MVGFSFREGEIRPTFSFPEGEFSAMVDPGDPGFRARLAEKLADSLFDPLPAATPRRVHGTATLPGKATAVIGMRRAGKTTYLHP